MGLPYNRKPEHTMVLAEQMLLGGSTRAEVIKRLGVSGEWLRVHFSGIGPRKVRSEEVRLWQKQRNEGLPIWWIAEQAGRSEWSVRNYTTDPTPPRVVQAKMALKASSEKRARERRNRQDRE